MELTDILIIVVFFISLLTIILIPTLIIYYKFQSLKLKRDFETKMIKYNIDHNKNECIQNELSCIRLIKSGNKIEGPAHPFILKYKNYTGNTWIPEICVIKEKINRN
jgi:hypothetical protein